MGRDGLSFLLRPLAGVSHTLSLAHRRRRLPCPPASAALHFLPLPSRNQSVLWGGERDWMRPRGESKLRNIAAIRERARRQGEDAQEEDQINELPVPDRLELRRARVSSARLKPQLMFLQWKIEKAGNTSVTADEVLSDRLGLIPLDVDGSKAFFYHITENDAPLLCTDCMFHVKRVPHGLQGRLIFSTEVFTQLFTAQ